MATARNGAAEVQQLKVRHQLILKNSQSRADRLVHVEVAVGAESPSEDYSRLGFGLRLEAHLAGLAAYLAKSEAWQVRREVLRGRGRSPPLAQHSLLVFRPQTLPGVPARDHSLQMAQLVSALDNGTKRVLLADSAL